MSKKVMPLEKRKITNSRLALGCMGHGGSWDSTPYAQEDVLKAEKALDAALESGITMLDHADIYTRGKAEQIFGDIFRSKPSLRDQLVIQSKCGIKLSDVETPRQFDFSKKHILKSVDGILERLSTEYIDILLLHRPDPLMEPDEIAEAFNILKSKGKVRHFGVSNMTAAQMNYIQAAISESLVVNQLEMSLARTDWIDQGVLVNQKVGSSINFADGIIEYCRMNDVQIQAWAPLAYGNYSGKELDNPTENILKTKEKVQQMAQEKETTAEAIVLGWLMKHPAMIQPVIGTTNPQRIKNCQDAARISELMTRDEWNILYNASTGRE